MIEVIPAIDIIEGKCVRLTKGDFSRKKTYGDPVEVARKLEEHGLKRLHLVDLDGARARRVVNHGILERIASRTSLVIDAGGGIRTDEDLRIVFQSGAQMATGGSVAVKERATFTAWLERYGPERIILGADFRKDAISVSGWFEETRLDLLEFLGDYLKKGIRMAICTDIERDGMLGGPATDTYIRIKKAWPHLNLIASGGVSSMVDVEELDNSGIDGVILGKAIYENRIGLKELESYISNG